MYDISDFLPVGATWSRGGIDCLHVTTREAVYVLDIEERTVTICPEDRAFSLRELRDLLAKATAFESDLDDEAWSCIETTFPWVQE